MQTIFARFATTHVDAHGEQAGAEALPGMAEVINQHYLPFGVDHDPRIAPVGRIASATIEAMRDGHLSVAGAIEVWDGGDTPESITGDGRRLPAPTEPEGLFEVVYDRSAAAELGHATFTDFAALAGPSAEAKYHAKKAVDPISTILIAGGVFAAGGIANGFLKRLGEDVYAALKSKLTAATKPRPTGDRLLVLHFGVQHGPELVTVDLIATNPTLADLSALFSTGLPSLDALVFDTLRAHPNAGKIVTHLDSTGVRLLYWVRADGVPSVLRPIDPARLAHGGVSMAGIARLESRAGDV